MNLAGDSPQRPRTTSVRVLMLSIVNPHVERNGAATVTRGLLKLLAMPPLEAQVDCVPVRAIPHRWHRVVQARSVLFSVISGLPSKAAFLYSREFRDEVVARVERVPYDLVILNGSDLIWILEYLPASIPRILVAHNIEHLLFDAQIQNLGGLYRPIAGLLRRDCQRLKDYELQGIRETGNVLFLSHDDAAYAGGLCNGLSSTIVPPVFDYQPRPRQHSERRSNPRDRSAGQFRMVAESTQPAMVCKRDSASREIAGAHPSVRIAWGRRGWRSDPRIVEHGVVERYRRSLGEL